MVLGIVSIVGPCFVRTIGDYTIWRIGHSMMLNLLARWATAIQLLFGGISTRYRDSSYVSSKELLKTFLTEDGSKRNPGQNLAYLQYMSSMVPVMVTGTNTWLAKMDTEDTQNQS